MTRPNLTSLAVGVAAAMLLAGASLSGCEKEQVLEKSVRSSTTVELPSKPSLQKPEYTKHHPDGVWTVEGIRRDHKEALGKTVRVRGKIVELVKCPPPKPYTQAELDYHAERHKKWEKLVKLAKKIKKIPPEEPVLKPKKQARTCNPRPRAVLQDTPPNERFKLLVAGSMYSPLKDFEEGQVVTIEGLFDMVSPDGQYMQQDGLMYLKDLPQEEEEGEIQEAPGEPAPKNGAKPAADDKK